MIVLPPSQAFDQLTFKMKNHSNLMAPEKWQAQDVDVVMCELLHEQVSIKLSTGIDILAWQQEIPANLPWAEDHFLERVCGVPINPGVEWKNWPWANKAVDSLEPNGQFNHNYMERFWPKYWMEIPTSTPDDFDRVMVKEEPSIQCGMRHEYGDLGDVIHTLANEPTTRQAYLPIWFPEDTSQNNKGRKPCTLGYHFIMRNGKLDITYPIRSCDFFRHFYDDVYMAVRLAIHVLQSCRTINPEVWRKVELGTLVMNITSLHMFLSDYHMVFQQEHPQRKA